MPNSGLLFCMSEARVILPIVISFACVEHGMNPVNLPSMQAETRQASSLPTQTFHAFEKGRRLIAEGLDAAVRVTKLLAKGRIFSKPVRFKFF